jgi:hypothetical protein
MSGWALARRLECVRVAIRAAKHVRSALTAKSHVAKYLLKEKASTH